MKKLLLIFLLFPFSLIAQSESIQDSVPGTSFILRNNEVLFSKVYDSSLQEGSLMESLESFLPNIGNFEFKINSSTPNQYNGNLTGNTINYRKYGGTLMGTNIVLNYPVYANVIIQVKDYKYRVLVTNMSIKGVPNALSSHPIDHLLDDIVTRKKRSEFRRSGEAIKTLEYIDMHFTDIFNITTPKVIDSNF